MRTVLGCALAVALAVTAGASGSDKDSPIDGKKLIGRWEPKDGKKGDRVVLEFARDGKVQLTADAAGKTEKYTGTYKLTGNKLSVAIRIGEMDVKQENTILKLTDDELTTEDPKGAKETLRKLK